MGNISPSRCFLLPAKSTCRCSPLAPSSLGLILVPFHFNELMFSETGIGVQYEGRAITASEGLVENSELHP